MSLYRVSWCAWVTVDLSGLLASSGSAVATDGSASDYLERLKVLRARCGLDNDANTRADSSLSDVAVGVTKPHVSTSHVLDGGGVSAVSVLA